MAILTEKYIQISKIRKISKYIRLQIIKLLTCLSDDSSTRKVE